MEQKYLIDTNVLIDAQMNRLPKQGLSFLAKIINDNFTISFITKIEFLGYKEVPKSSEEFISLASVIGVDDSVIDICISLRKIHKIKLPDAILAATALIYNLTLITRNISDFKDIKDLKVIDPHDI